MPSLALPAVVPAIPVLPAAQAGVQDAALDAAQQPAADGTNASVFAAVLGRQMSAACSATSEAAPLPAGATAVPEDQADPAAQPPLDVAALLQGLMLPLAPPPAQASATAGGAARPSLVDTMPNASTTDGEAPRDLPALAVAAQPATSTAPDLRAVPADELERTAIDAAASGNTTAESAVAERALAAGHTEQTGLAQAQLHAREMRETPREPLVVHTPVSSPKWHEDIGTKVSMLIGKDVSSAQLVLTPPSLGRVEVELVVNGDQTSAVFVAATPAARDALEQALPKLREFLADAGIELSQASVGGQNPGDRGQGEGRAHARGSSAGDTAAGGEASGMATALRRSDGMVDTFA